MNEINLFSKWNKLYQRAIEFKELKPWEFMGEADLFGVENPFNGEIGYCCVMGKLGQHFALAFYQGTEGLNGLLALSSKDVDIYTPDALHFQKCLMLSLEDRELLLPEDREIIKKLGLRFRGQNAWPCFRNYRPGYFPWFLSESEIDYLIEAIPQAITVIRRFKDNPEILIPDRPDSNCYLVRTARKEDGKLIWEDSWREPPPLPEKQYFSPPLNDILLEKLRQSAETGGGDWELDCFYSHLSVHEGKTRPYFPRMLVGMDHETGLILFHHIVEEGTDYRLEFIDKFITAAENYKLLPPRIAVRNQELACLFSDLADKLGVELILAKRLPQVEEMRTHMENFEFEF